MFKLLSNLVDKLSEFLAPRKGLLPFLGLVLIVCNYFLQFLPLDALGWISRSNLLLHAGLILAIFGLMLAWAL